MRKHAQEKEKSLCLNWKYNISDIKMSEFQWKKVVPLTVPIFKNAGQCLMFLGVSFNEI